MRFRNLESYRSSGAGSDMQLAIPLPRTPDGRVYRYSPNENAHPRHFLLGGRVEGVTPPEAPTPRMTHAPGTPGTICPYSGVKAEDGAFTHPDDIAAAKEVVAHAAAADVAEVFHGMFADLGRKFAGSKFVKIKPGPKPYPKPRPRFARRDLLRDLICDECGRDYGVFAISLFCPDCGAPNIHLHFAREATLVREQVELAGKLDAGADELAYRLLGNAHEDVLTAFEATLKTVYLYKLTTRPADAPEVKPPGNAFQNIERGRKRFSEFDFDPFGALSADALAVLTLNIQKRHVIGHNLGVADAAFAEHATDARLGETVPLVGEDILQFADICKTMIDHIDAWLANGVSPPGHGSLPARPIVAPQAKEPAALTVGQLGKLAVSIGLWVSERSKKGFDDFIAEEDLRKAFPDSTIDDLAFAVAELAKDGYLRTSAVISKRIPRMRTTAELFITFDPHAVKTDPASDVVVIVDLALTKSDTVGVEELHAATGWPLRRFNPAFAYMISQINERRVLGGGTNDYPARGFFLMDEDRVDLKRFADRLRG
ncbi:hypothetical protein [Bradyrhizobium sp. 192]|uniref:hypothetical protein n=1 Tax=Bradyrhizobium sp. 192 TaxID=2782660 RepID=UPI0020002FB8|nr:hypothetical protein [Bradyrhizobium sp. 192]UPJ57014.1 hypothetical protein IVB24_31300 [Bradyrhizobium sp. 192]